LHRWKHVSFVLGAAGDWAGSGDCGDSLGCLGLCGRASPRFREIASILSIIVGIVGCGRGAGGDVLRRLSFFTGELRKEPEMERFGAVKIRIAENLAAVFWFAWPG